MIEVDEFEPGIIVVAEIDALEESSILVELGEEARGLDARAAPSVVVDKRWLRSVFGLVDHV